jgi:hypothetical protein
MGIEKEITEILDECEADDLARYLLARTRMLRPPNWMIEKAGSHSG